MFYAHRVFKTGMPPAYTTPHEPFNQRSGVKLKRDFFPRRRFRPVPLTEVSLTNIKGQLISR